MDTAGTKKRYNPSEGAIDKCQVGTRIDLFLMQKVLEKYGKKGDTNSSAVIRALEASVEGFKLSEKGNKAVVKKIQLNYERRMDERKTARKNPVIVV